MIKQANLKQQMPKLPKGVRCSIYSFLDISCLITQISKLSKAEMQALKSAGEILDQPRDLIIDTKTVRPKDRAMIEHSVAICNTVQVKVSSGYARDIFAYI